MGLEWDLEEKTLLSMKKVIAAAWRMNSQQLRVYCRKLQKNQERVLPGRTGSAFVKKLAWVSVSGTDAGNKIWPCLMQDADSLLKIVNGYRNLDRKSWPAVLSKLEASQARYFKTELGMAFILELKEKTGAGISDDKKHDWCAAFSEGSSGWEASVNAEKELEKVAAWLMVDVQEQNETAETKKAFSLPWQVKKAAVPALACLSVCFMSIWLFGQIASSQSRLSLQQMKTSASQEADVFVEKNTGPVPGTENYTQKLADAGQAVKKVQIQGKKRTESRPEKLPQYREMSEEYPHLYGWLQIPGTQIDFPVMRTESDRDFYLHHDFSGAESSEGALFVDAESSIYPQDGNTVIYGHNMKNGHMFGTLKMYGDADFFRGHRKIQFDTLYETGAYEAVAVLKTRILNENEQGFRYYQFFNYENEKEFQECWEFVEENRLFGAGSTLQYGDRILMLSTCEYSQENGRLVVVARKMRKKPDVSE